MSQSGEAFRSNTQPSYKSFLFLFSKKNRFLSLYQLFTKFAAFTDPIPVAKSHPVVVPYAFR
jgi:hypothetical protein